MNFFLVTPHSSDPLFKEKKVIVENLANSHHTKAFFGPQPPYKELDIKSNINLYHQVDFLIGDLSYERPSSYFEVGYAQALGKPVYLIAFEGTDIHQVLNRNKVKFYKNLDEYKIVIDDIISVQSKLY